MLGMACVDQRKRIERDERLRSELVTCMDALRRGHKHCLDLPPEKKNSQKAVTPVQSQAATRARTATAQTTTASARHWISAVRQQASPTHCLLHPTHATSSGKDDTKGSGFAEGKA